MEVSRLPGRFSGTKSSLKWKITSFRLKSKDLKYFLDSFIFLTILDFLPVSTKLQEGMIPEAHLESSQTSKMKHFAKIANTFQLLTISVERLYLRCLNRFWLRLCIGSFWYVICIYGCYMYIDILEKKNSRLSFRMVELLMPAQVLWSGCAKSPKKKLKSVRSLGNKGVCWD